MSSSFFKKRLSPIKPGDPIDYKDVDLLKKFITERGKILPRRLTGLTAKQQRDLTNSVKRARIVALLPFVNPEAEAPLLAASTFQVGDLVGLGDERGPSLLLFGCGLK
jgi:ribosomal protein S18